MGKHIGVVARRRVVGVKAIGLGTPKHPEAGNPPLTTHHRS
jgi:hypothetical protein